LCADAQPVYQRATAASIGFYNVFTGCERYECLPLPSRRDISIHMSSEPAPVVLTSGELYSRRRFGPNTVNRGAALLECEWDGGSFESGLFIAGMFRSGQFLGGVFLGGIFWDGAWTEGTWEGGFDRNGMYRYRGDNPARR
jgi:hypothetical protein